MIRNNERMICQTLTHKCIKSHSNWQRTSNKHRTNDGSLLFLLYGTCILCNTYTHINNSVNFTILHWNLICIFPTIIQMSKFITTTFYYGLFCCVWCGAIVEKCQIPTMCARVCVRMFAYRMWLCLCMCHIACYFNHNWLNSKFQRETHPLLCSIHIQYTNTQYNTIQYMEGNTLLYSHRELGINGMNGKYISRLIK